MTNDLIAQARKRYLAAHPVRTNAVPSFASGGSPAGVMTFPNLDDFGVIGCKLGMEYLAICHNQELVEEWINSAMGIAKSPDMVGVLFANVFRGVNVVIGTIIADASLREQMEKLAVDAWTRDFSGDAL